jgi:hypothetical protein
VWNRITTHRPLGRVLRNVIVGAAVAAALLPGPPARAAMDTRADGTQLRLLQFNLCNSGSVCPSLDPIPLAASRIKATRPDVVTLNESCEGDLARLAPAMGANAKLIFVPARSRHTAGYITCGKDGNRGERFGNGIILREGLFREQITGAYRNQDDTEEERTFACVRTADLYLCATHLSATRTVALEQCIELEWLFGEVVGQVPVHARGVLAGQVPSGDDLGELPVVEPEQDPAVAAADVEVGL